MLSRDEISEFTNRLKNTQKEKKIEAIASLAEMGIYIGIINIMFNAFAAEGIHKIIQEKENENSYGVEQTDEEVSTFLLSNLFVIEKENRLYIINKNLETPSIYTECHNLFAAFYNLHPDNKDNHTFDFCPQYVHIYDEDITPLYEYLDDETREKIEEQNGKVSMYKVNKIEEQINEKYKKEKNKTTSKVKTYKYQNLWQNIGA